MKRTLLTVTACILLISAKAQTGQSWFYNIDSNNLGINGYDLISYFEDGEPSEGSEEFRHAYKDVVYQFSSEKNLKKFIENPSKYLPKYGGWCAYRMAQKPEEVGWAQSRIPSNPKTFIVINDSLYLFSTVAGNAKQAWEQHDEMEMIQRANDYWKSRIVLSKLADGKPDELNPTARMENLLWQRFMGKWNGSGKSLVGLEPKKYAPFPPAVWTFWYGFDGYCIQDEWMTSNDMGGTWNGPAIRGYDPLKKEWHMTFIPINNGRNATLLMTGKFNEKMELEGKTEGIDARGKKYLQRIYFYDITENSFKWKADRSYDEGNSWIEGFFEIVATR